LKLLFLDIETAPNLATVWGLYDQNIALNQLLKPGYTLCWAAKWHKESHVHFSSIMTGHKRMIRGIHKLMCQADAICHYNGNKFDIPTLNKEFMLMGLSPPTPAKQIDLLRTAKSRFRLASNKLDFVAKSLGVGAKTEHKGHELWLECMAKNPESWKTMETYNKQDVHLLEKVYDRLLPWVDKHPNLSAMGDTFCCPKCESRSYQQRGYSTQLGGKFRRYQCKDCGSWFRLNLREPGQRTKAVSVG
jgi:DNA polymerase elongation subunit (family B)